MSIEMLIGGADVYTSLTAVAAAPDIAIPASLTSSTCTPVIISVYFDVTNTIDDTISGTHYFGC